MLKVELVTKVIYIRINSKEKFKLSIQNHV
jgi:hypothetical protein